VIWHFQRPDNNTSTTVFNKLAHFLHNSKECQNSIRNRDMAEQKSTKFIYEQPDINLFDLLESRRVEAQEQYETLHKRIGSLRDELYEEVASSHKEIMKEIKEMKEESKAHHDKMDDRLSELERWKWVVVGGACIIGFFIAQMDIGSFFS